jgi:hypothetical protein
VFAPAEMARAGMQPWPRSIDTYVLSNVFVLLAINYQSLPQGLWLGLGQGLWLSAALLLAIWASLLVARSLWRSPTRRRLNLSTFLALLPVLGMALLVKRYGAGLDRKALEIFVVLALTCWVVMLTSWWFLTIFRVQQIEARLRELADQEEGKRLARRLATAQIQPHFLFNTLASLQHWVDTQDPRAGPTLRSFTRYLRATLPMFEQERLPLDQELQIVRSYLEVMQARLGARLAWQIQAAPELQDLTLPPGALLTLVENAIGHGIEPALRGGRIDVRAYREGAALRLEVQDDGAGLCTETAGGDGLGLANTRERLQQLYGAHASLQLLAQQPGCLARITIHDEGDHSR